MSEKDEKKAISQSNLQKELSLPVGAAPEIENMEIIELLGKGGMSHVYKARQKKLDRIVAVKVLSKITVGGEVGIKRFRQEAKLTSMLDHPNIVKIISFGVSTDEHPYLVMEFLQGLSLAEHLKQNGRLKLQRFKNTFLPVLSALHQAHQAGLVHRDIKPGNIMICKTDTGGETVKLVDFGIAKVLEDEVGNTGNLTRSDAVPGSPAYMSPEQYQGKRLDGRSDLYSVACVMHEALTGEPPFTASSILELISKHGVEAPPSAEALCKKIDIGKKLAELISSGLAKDPDLRPSTALEFEKKLDAALKDTDLDLVPRLKRGGVKPYLWIWFIAGLLILGVSILFAIMSLRSSQNPITKTNQYIEESKVRGHLKDLAKHIATSLQEKNMNRSEIYCREAILAMGSPDYKPSKKQSEDDLTLLKNIAQVYDLLGAPRTAGRVASSLRHSLTRIEGRSLLAAPQRSELLFAMAGIQFFYGEYHAGADSYLRSCRILISEKNFRQCRACIAELKAMEAPSEHYKSIILFFANLAEAELDLSESHNKQGLLCVRAARKELVQASGDSFSTRKNLLLALLRTQQTLDDAEALSTVLELETMAKKSIGNVSLLEDLGNTAERSSPFNTQVIVLNEVLSACEKEELKHQVAPLLNAALENKKKTMSYIQAKGDDYRL